MQQKVIVPMHDGMCKVYHICDYNGVDEIVDEEKYATYISQMFLADFYTLNSALNKNDVGGVQFVYKDYQEDFLKNSGLCR